MNPDIRKALDEEKKKLQTTSTNDAPTETVKQQQMRQMLDDEKKNLTGGQPSVPSSNGAVASSPSNNTPQGFGSSQFASGSDLFKNDFSDKLTQKIGDKSVDLRESAPLIYQNEGRDQFAKELQGRINSKTITKADIDFLSTKSGYSADEVGLAIYEPQKFGKYSEITGRINNAEVSLEDMNYLATNLPAYAKGLIKKIAPDIKSDENLSADALSLATDRINKYIQGKINESKAAYYKGLDAGIKKELTGQGIDVTKLPDDSYAESVWNKFNADKNTEYSLIARKYPLKTYPPTSMGAGGTYRMNQGQFDKEIEGLNNKYARLFSVLATSRTNDIAKTKYAEDPYQIGLEYLKYADRDKYLLQQKAGKGTAIDRDIAQAGVNSLYTTDKPGIWDLLATDEKNLDNFYPDKKRSEVYHKLGAILYEGENWFLNAAPGVKQLDAAAEKLDPKDKQFYFDHIREIERRNIGTAVPLSGFLNKVGEGFGSTAIETGKFFGDVTGLRTTQDQAIDALDQSSTTNFQDVGSHPESKMELDQLKAKLKDTGKLSVTEEKRKEELEKYTDIRSTGQEILDGTGNLTGQVLFQALATKGLGGAVTSGVEATGLLKAEQLVQGLSTEAAIANQATNFGISKGLINALSADAIAFGSSYDASMRDALTLFPDDKDITKRKIYANTVAGLNAATERIFKDEKVLDAFSKEVAPNISKLVSKMGAEGLTKDLFKSELNQIIKNGLTFIGHATLENVKETTEELATSIGTSVTKLVLEPAKFNSKEAYNDALSTVTTMFLNGGLVAGMAGAHSMRENHAAIPMLSNLGVDPSFTQNVKAEINRQLLSGDLSNDEANAKFRMFNDAVSINKDEMPLLAGKGLSEKTRNKYFTMLLHEKELQYQLAHTTDDLTKQQLTQQIDESKTVREGIFKKEVTVNDDYVPETIVSNSSSNNNSNGNDQKQNGNQSQSSNSQGNNQAQEQANGKGQGNEKGVLNNNGGSGTSAAAPVTNEDDNVDLNSEEYLKKVASSISNKPADEPPPPPAAAGAANIAEPITTEKAAGDVVMKNIAAISTDPKRFQPRENAFNSESRDRVVNNFDNNSLDPIVLYKDPTNGKDFVLSGHSRLAAHEILSSFDNFKKAYPEKSEADYKKVLADAESKGFEPGNVKSRYFNGTEQEAIDFAQRSNNLARGNTTFENAAYLQKLRSEGKSEKEIREMAKTDFGKNSPAVYAQSFLNPSGKTNAALRSFAGAQEEGTDNDIAQVANWIGQVRQTYGSRITNTQEDEMFDFLLKNKKDKTITTARDFITKIGGIVNSAFYNNADPLNLHRVKYKTSGEVNYDAEMQEINHDITTKENEIEKINSRLRNVNDADYINPNAADYQDVLKAADDKLGKLREELQALRKQKLDHIQNKSKYITSGLNQQGLFDTFTPTILSNEEVDQVNEDVKELTDGEVNDFIGNFKNVEDEQKNISAEQDAELAQQANQAKDIKPVQKNVQQSANEQGPSAEQNNGGEAVPGQQRASASGVVGDATEAAKRAKLEEKKAAFKDALKKSMGKLTSGGIDPEVLRAGVELVASYVELGVYKFGQIASEIAKDFGDTSAELLRALKQAYGGYIAENDNPEMDEIKTVRDYQFEPVTAATPEKLTDAEQEVIDAIKADPAMKDMGLNGASIYSGATSDDINMQREAIKLIAQQAASNPVDMEMAVGKSVIDKVIAMNLPEINQAEVKPASSPNIRNENKKVTVGGKEFVFVGKNIDGTDLYEDKNGVRTKPSSPNNLIFTTEPVNIIPTAQGYQTMPSRPDDYKTIAEIEQELGKEIEKPRVPDNARIEANEPQRLFTDTVKQRIINAEKQNITTLRKLADELGLSLKDTHLQELAELAVVELSREVALSNGTDDIKLSSIINIYNNQPSITMRSSERIALQQYSTPVPTSFIGGMYVGAINPRSIIEPSAGNGMMSIYFDPSIVHANEIDAVRLDNLSKQNFGTVTKQDAMEPFNIAKKDGLVMNPPFGSSAEKNIDGFKIAGLDEQMIINALNTLKPGGRASIIMGGHNSFDEKGRLKADKNFFNYLYSHYHVADVINIDGELYRKQGTTFPIRMILIDGRKDAVSGMAPLKNESSSSVVTSFEDLYNRVNTIKDIRYGTNILSAGLDANTGEGNVVYGEAAAGENPEGQNGLSPIPAGQVQPVNPGGNGSERTPGGPDRTNTGNRNNGIGTNATGNGSSNNEQRPLQDVGAEIPEQRESGGGEAINPGGEGYIRGNEPLQSIRKFDVSELSNEKVAYRPKSQGTPVGTVIPTQMATDAEKILNDIEHEYGGIDHFVQSKLKYKDRESLFKAFSGEQIDAIAMAVKQIEAGQGMIIGDMTGVGKGRIAAGIVRYAVLQGHKPFFMTEKPNLFSDLYRDLMAIGSEKLVPFIVNDKSSSSDPTITDEEGNIVHKVLGKTTKKNIFETGVLPKDIDFLMSTYSQFTTGANKPSIKKEFFLKHSVDNVLILDESHNVSGDSNSGLLFQDALSNAKGVTYLSATFAKRPDNMPVYAVRTAMQEANMTKEELINAIVSGGVALQEVVSSQLVQSGQMLRRERSFEGVDVNYEVLENTSQEHRRIANNVTEIIRDIIDFQKIHVNELIDRMDTELAAQQGNVGGKKGTSMAGVDNTPFASKVFNVIDQLLFSIKSDEVARIAIEEAKAGRKPVIGFKSTMESFLKDLELSAGEKLGKIDFSLTLNKGLRGTMRYTEKDYQGNKTHKNLSTFDLSPEGQKAYRDIEEKIKAAALGISVSPIDNMIKRIKDAGLTVAEITGRDQMLDIQDDGSAIVITRTNKDVKKISRDFNNGNLDVIMINASGATGISLHASKTFKDQRQRVMIDGQLELDINKAVQKRGRIDRTGQVVRGAYRYVVSDIPAEQRLLMMFKSKLKSLDANTTSSQKSKSSDVAVVDFLNKYGDEIVTEYLKEDKEINEKLLDPLKLNAESDEDLEKITKVDGAARKVTGRVAILNSDDQDNFYREITQRYNDYLEYLESNNSNDLEVKVLPLNAATLNDQVVIVGKGGVTPFGADTIRERVEVDVLKKPMTKQEIDTEVEHNLNGVDPMQQSKDNVVKINEYYDGFMEREKQAISDEIERKREGIADAVRQKAIKDGVPNVQAEVDGAMERLDFSKREKTERLMTKYENIRQVLSRQMGYFKTGEVYEVPTSIKVETSFGTVKGVFLGFQIKETAKNPYAPSNIKMRFATNDGRRMVSVPLSKQAFVNSVIANSSQYQIGGDDKRANVRENWDALKSSRTRDQRYIITGNLLQAYGTNDGQLVSYTDNQGNLKKGLLLPEDYKPEEQKVRLPIIRAVDYILKSNVPVTTVDREVTIGKERGGFTIEVPLSRSTGGKYFLDQNLRALVNGNDFKQMGGRMVGYFSQSKLNDVLEYLQNTHNSSVDVENYQETDANKSLADKIRDLKIKGKDNLFSLVPPFNLVPAAWNAAIEIAALTIQGGGKLFEAARRALNYIKANYPDADVDEVEFQDAIKSQLIDDGTIPQTMNRETLKMAKLAVNNIKQGSTIDAELAKVRNFFDRMKAIMTTDEEKNNVDSEYAMFEEYVRGNSLERPAGASASQQEALDKAAAMKEGLEERIFTYSPETLWQKFLDRAASTTDSVLSVGGKIFNLPNLAQEKTIGWLTKKGGDEFKKVAGKQLAGKNKYVRGIAKAMNSMISGMGKTSKDINAGEKLQGESKRRSVSDAAKISQYLRALVDNNKTALVNIDQVIDPEFYEYLYNMSEEDFAKSVKYDEPSLTDAEVTDRYKKFREDFGFDKPDYRPLTENDLSPEEQSTYKIIRELYDYMHELNYGMGKLTDKTYYANYKKYSARMYDEFELPAEINESLKNTPLKMDVDLYMKRGNLTSWKALHKLQDPIYGVTKRLYQTLANKAVLDYAEHIVTNRPDVISAGEKPGFTKLGEGYGKLSNTYVRDDMAEDFKGYFFASHQLQKFYEFIKAYDRMPVRQFYKKVFTVYNPGVHLANIMGNTWFGMLSGVNPLRLNLNLLYAKQQIDSYGADYRQLLSDGVIGSDYSREDLIQKTDELFNKNNKPDDNQNVQQNGVLPVTGKTIKTFLGKMQDFYGATDDVYKIAAYRSFRQLGYNHEDAANKVKQGFQNYQRVGKAYDVGSKLPLIGNPFGKFAGDLARIVISGMKERPLTTMAFLGSLQAVGLMVSQSNGEDDEQRRKRMNRPGVAKIPVPEWFPEWLGGGREGGVSLAWKLGGDQELNIAKYLSPVFVYSAYDGDNSAEFLNKFSPLPIEQKPDFTYNPNGVWAVFAAKNANDPLLAPIIQLLVNSDFRGMPILDPEETKYRQSAMSDKEKSINSLRFLARAYVPHGAYGDDFIRAVKGDKDYYNRQMTPGQIFARFLGYKTIPFDEEKYDEILDKRVKYWGNQFNAQAYRMNTLLEDQANEKVSEEQFETRQSEILQKQAELVNEANKEVWKMTGEEMFFEPPDESK